MYELSQASTDKTGNSPSLGDGELKKMDHQSQYRVRWNVDRGIAGTLTEG